MKGLLSQEGGDRIGNPYQTGPGRLLQGTCIIRWKPFRNNTGCHITTVTRKTTRQDTEVNGRILNVFYCPS